MDTAKRTPREQVLKDLGEFIESQMLKRERYLQDSGKVERGRKLSRAYMAERIGVSRALVNDIVKGNKMASDNLLIRIANFLEIDENVIFQIARKIHPDKLEEYKQDYLGEYYVEKLDW